MDNSSSVSESSGKDPLMRMRVYQIARALVPDAWHDAERLGAHHATRSVSSQLYLAVGSIAANISEGYSRSSGRDRARFFEYALGSVRESMEWYRAADPLLPSEIAQNRLDRLEEMRRMLLVIIPRERGRPMPGSTQSSSTRSPRDP